MFVMIFVRFCSILVLSLSAFLFLPAHANDDAPLMSDQEKRMATNIRSLLKTLRNIDITTIEVHKLERFDNLYEVVLENESMVYTNQEMTYFIQGRLLDGKTLSDLSALSLQKYNKVDIASLALEHSIKVIKGNGKRQLYTFEDPRCGYCKKLAHELKEMDNITINVFVIGLLGPESVSQGKAILCSDNPSEAWLQTMLESNPPNNAGDCPNALESNTALARKLRITGTPAIIFEDGSRFSGYVPRKVLEEKLLTLEKAAQTQSE